jgi:hypothetical protein
MNFDLRFPIGLMFSVYGALLVIFGISTSGQPMYAEHSLGMNINLIWGAVQLVFGLVMLAMALRRQNPS